MFSCPSWIPTRGSQDTKLIKTESDDADVMVEVKKSVLL